MRSILIAALAATFMSGSAMAADFALSETAVPAHAASSAFDWSGFYVGVTAGAGAGTIQDVANPQAAAQDLSGATYGVTVGYNAQLDGGIVLGVEGDWSAANIGKDWAGNETNQFDPYYGSDRITSLATLRGRIGFAVDRFLPYLTAGLAFGSTEHTLGCDADLVELTNGCGALGVNGADDPGAPFETSNTGSSVGWTVGAGAEVAVTDNLSLKGEVLYGDLGQRTVELVDPFYPAATDREFATTFTAVRLGVNLSF